MTTLLTAPPGEVEKAAAAAALIPQEAGRPAFLPEAYWDAETGQARLAELMQALEALQAQVARMVEVPGPEAAPEMRAAFDRARGVPERPEDYAIAQRHPLLGSDPDLNGLLHGKGFTPEQAQFVYDLAAERVLPVIESLAAEFDADRQLVRLVEHFGGEDRWREVSRQILAWGRAALPPDVLAALATTHEGVLTLHRMMTSGEPGLRGGTGQGPDVLDEDGLKGLMRDPRYWRDREPGLVRRVSEGFRRLYPEG